MWENERDGEVREHLTASTRFTSTEPKEGLAMKATQCEFPGCDRDPHSRGLCNSHYSQVHRGRPLSPLRPRRTGCLAEGCDRRHSARGYCDLHARRLRRNGDPMKLVKIADGRTRFASYFEQTDTCWLWTGHLDKDGYGHFRQGYLHTGAHRWAHMYFIGPIPERAVIDHLCRTRHCVNPDHLEAVTPQENFIRGVMAMEFNPDQYAEWLNLRRGRSA